MSILLSPLIIRTRDGYPLGLKTVPVFIGTALFLTFVLVCAAFPFRVQGETPGFVFLLLASLLTYRSLIANSRWGMYLAGICLGFSLLTKLAYLPYSSVIFFLFLSRRRHVTKVLFSFFTLGLLTVFGLWISYGVYSLGIMNYLGRISEWINFVRFFAMDLEKHTVGINRIKSIELFFTTRPIVAIGLALLSHALAKLWLNKDGESFLKSLWLGFFIGGFTFFAFDKTGSPRHIYPAYLILISLLVIEFLSIFPFVDFKAGKKSGWLTLLILGASLYYVSPFNNSLSSPSHILSLETENKDSYCSFLEKKKTFEYSGKKILSEEKNAKYLRPYLVERCNLQARSAGGGKQKVMGLSTTFGDKFYDSYEERGCVIGTELVFPLRGVDLIICQTMETIEPI